MGKNMNHRNPKSWYNWDKLDDMREDKDCADDYDNEDDNDEESDCSLPKRVLGFTTLKLFKIFAKSERGSLDGTFKFCCKFWKQLFVFMLKFNPILRGIKSKLFYAGVGIYAPPMISREKKFFCPIPLAHQNNYRK